MNIERVIRDIGEGPVVNLAGQVLALAAGAVILGVIWRDQKTIRELLDANIINDPFPACVQYNMQKDIFAFQPINGERYFCRPVGKNIMLHCSYDGNIVGFTRGNFDE